LTNNDPDNPSALDLAFTGSVLQAVSGTFDQGTQSSPSYVLEAGDTRTARFQRGPGAPAFGSSASCTISALLADGSTASTSVTVEGLKPTDYANWPALRAASSQSVNGLNFNGGASVGKWFDGNFALGGVGGAYTTFNGWKSGEYLTVDFGAPTRVDEIKIYVEAVSGAAWDSPGTYSVLTDLTASLDGVTYTSVLASDVEIFDGGNVAGDTLASGLWVRTYAFPQGTYRYIRLTNNGSGGTGHGYWYTTEIEFKVA
jgi:hypothetical protein